MSLKELEKAIKEVIRDFGTVENNYDARNLWEQIRKKIDAFKKQLQDNFPRATDYTTTKYDNVWNMVGTYKHSVEEFRKKLLGTEKP